MKWLETSMISWHRWRRQAKYGILDALFCMISAVMADRAISISVVELGKKNLTRNRPGWFSSGWESLTWTLFTRAGIGKVWRAVTEKAQSLLMKLGASTEKSVTTLRSLSVAARRRPHTCRRVFSSWVQFGIIPRWLKKSRDQMCISPEIVAEKS